MWRPCAGQGIATRFLLLWHRRSLYQQFLANADAVERLQPDGRSHGFGVRDGWIPDFDQWLTGIFTDN